MTSEFNLIAIYIANIFGVTLLSVMLIANSWRLKANNLENRLVSTIVFMILLTCIVEPIVFTLDGKPGVVNWWVVFLGNGFEYFANLVLSTCWFCFFSLHFFGKVNKHNKTFIAVCVSVLGFGLLANIFYPIAFSVDENSAYHREFGYAIYTLYSMFMIIASLGLYFRARKNGGVLKMFPILAFLVPVIVGVVVQAAFYGISIVAACMAIGLSGVLAALQNELIFRDKLTHLYNRFYLDRLFGESTRRLLSKSSVNSKMTGMMIDLNDFKRINDELGHTVGDEVLVKTGEILQSSVGEHGVVLRYAGDEFVVFLNTQDDVLVENIIVEMREAFEQFNADPSSRYVLSISYGYSKVDMNETDASAFLNEIDRKMYENKREYYKTHPRNDRRSSTEK